MDITADYDAISQCNRCGFCQVACPVFRSTGQESGVARGRLALLRGIIEERVPWGRELEDPLFTCLGCGACTANCFGAVPLVDLIITARGQYLEQVGRKSIHKLLFDHLLPYPDRLHLAARAVAMGKKTGLSKLAGALGLLRVLGRDLARADRIIDRLPATAFRQKIVPGIYAGSGRKLSVGYFVGCGIDIIQQRTGHATLGLLRNIARQVIVLDNGCCGLPAWTYGDMPAARRLMRKNLEMFTRLSVDLIVTDCSSCAGFLKKYDTIAARTCAADSVDDSKKMPAVPEIRDMVEFLCQHRENVSRDDALPDLNPSRQGCTPIVVTYHDPCHAVRGQGLGRESRELLDGLPDMVFREMPESDWCCGGAGAYALSHYDLSMTVLDRKMDNVAATGADLLVTSCPACMIQLSHGVRRKQLDTRVCHISEIYRYRHGRISGG
ncbi:MAG: (Fe-S)-binding protein [Desulfotignum sp.]|nr:(Fe-S)-binding protein [Desulfotignum sp.]